jgi:putative copper export protein
LSAWNPKRFNRQEGIVDETGAVDETKVGQESTDLGWWKSLLEQGRKWALAATLAAPALPAVLLVLSGLALLVTLERFHALTEGTAPYLHLADRLASVCATGFLTLPLIAFKSFPEKTVNTVLRKARRLWDWGIVLVATCSVVSLAHLVAHYADRVGPSSLSGLFEYLAAASEGRLLALQAALLVAALVTSVVTDIPQRELEGRGQPRLVVVVLTSAAVGAGALASADETMALAGRFLLAAHVVSAALWVGGLGALLLLAFQAREQLEDLAKVCENYSQLALTGAVTVVVTGGGLGLAGLGGPWSSFLKGLGVVVLLKGMAAAVLVAVGYRQRQNVKEVRGEGRCERSVTGLAAWGVLELVIMFTTFGLSVGLTELIELWAETAAD